MNVSLRRLLWRWHRRLALVACALIVLLSITGVLLNHANQLGWDTQWIKQPWLLSSYGISVPETFQGAHIQGAWWVLGGHQLFRESQAVAECDQPWRDVVGTTQWVFAVCDTQWLLLLPDGSVVESHRQPAQTGLTAMGVAGPSTVLMAFSDTTYVWNIDQFSLAPAPSDVAVPTSQSQAVPSALSARVAAQYGVPDLTWQRWIQDLHAGRWFGGWGWVLSDLAALALLLLSATGFLTWAGRSRR